MKPFPLILAALLAYPVHGYDEASWHEAQWIACDRPLTQPQLAPAERMGDWIIGPQGQQVSGYQTMIELPDLPIVRAMAWWGTQQGARAVPVINGDERFFEKLVRQPKNELDLAFLLKPGSNLLDLRFEKPVAPTAVNLGLLIQFADGSERKFRTSPAWKSVCPDGKEHATTSRGGYAEADLPAVATYPHRRIAPAWFRTKVAVEKPLKSATLRQCSMGYGDPFINGSAVSDRVLSPPQTDYEAIAMYETDDVTHLLKQGENTLSILLASGWFHQTGGFSSSFTYGRPRLRATLELNYEDGITKYIVSNPSWLWKEGEIVESNIYNGDIVDYRRSHDEWATGKETEGWKPVRLSANPAKKLMSVDFQPMRRVREIEAVSVTQVGAETWLVDFGENISGWIKMGIDEEAGTEILVRYSEMARDNRLWNVPESHWWCHGEPQRDLIIAGNSPMIHEGRFSYKGFRWAEISGVSQAPDPAQLRAVVVHTDTPVIASFQSSDPLLNRFWEMGIRTHLSNMHSILEDCPHREKCQWGGDLHGSWAVGFHALDSAEFYRQQVRLYYTGPMAQGGIPGLIGVGKRLATVQMDFNWGVSPLFLTWRLWTQHGDLETAREFHPQMRHYLAYFSDKDPSGFPNLHRYADHAAPEDEIPRFPQDKALISAINYFAAAERFAQLSDALGKKEDAEWARALARKVQAAVMTRFDADQNTWGNGTHDSLALAMGVLRDDPAAEEKVAASMVAHYRKNGHKFDGGFMTYWLYPMLSRHGYADDALKMLVNPDYPGPAWSVKTWDATTFWEKFFTDEATQFERSLSHHATNHPAAWLLTDLAGIRIDMDHPGGKHFLLAPHFPTDLNQAGGSMQVGGRLELKSSWKRNGNEVVWNVTIPAGCAVRTELRDAYSSEPSLPKQLPPGSHEWRLTPKTP